MAVGVSDKNEILGKGLKTVFMKAYGDLYKQAGWRDLVTFVKSTDDTEVYPWLGDLPEVREWLGERQANDLSGGDFSIKNKKFESTIGVKRDDIDDDKLDGVKLRIRSMAAKMSAYPEKMVMAFLLGALSSASDPYLCHDGQGFFDSDHPAPDGGSAQANKVTVALTSANLWAGIEAMMMFRDTKNNPMGIVPDTLLVEPCLAETAIKLCNSEYHVDSAVANVTQSINALREFKLKPVVCPGLYSTTTAANGNWILLCTKGTIKPVILQERRAVEFAALEGESDAGFEREEYRYGTSWRGNVGAGLWFMAYGSTGAS